MRRPGAGIAWLLVVCASFAARSPALGVGDRAPDFGRPEITGTPFRLSDLRGRVVVLNFWASWCAPCVAEMPRFSAWQHEYGPAGLQIIGVAMDDDAAATTRFLARRPVGYRIVTGDAQLGQAFGGVLGLPLTFVIDRDGRIVAKHTGGDDLDSLLTSIKDALAVRGSPAAFSSSQ